MRTTKRIKSITSVMLSIAMIMQMFCNVSFVSKAASSSGTCGDNIQWSFEDGTLTVSGTGALENYSSDVYGEWADFVEDIKAVRIGEGITAIGDYVFYNYYELERVYLPETLEKIGQSAFSATKLRSVRLPASVTAVGSSAFSCDNMEYIFAECGAPGTGWHRNTLDFIAYSANKTMDWYSYRYATTLRCDVVPSSAETISAGKTDVTFDYSYSTKMFKFVPEKDGEYIISCPALTAYRTRLVVLDEGYGFIADNINGEEEIIVPLKKGQSYLIEGFDGPRTELETQFEIKFNCQHTMATGTETVVEPTCQTGGYTSYICSACGEEIITDETEIVAHDYDEDGFCTMCGIEFSVGGIYDSNEKNLTWSLNSKGVLTISGQGEMGYCYGGFPWEQYKDRITSLVVEEGVTGIRSSAFARCGALKTVKLPDSLETIGSNAFYGCTALESLCIPKNVNNIEMYAFGGCTGLKEVTFLNADPANIFNSAFYNVTAVGKFNASNTKWFSYANSSAFGGTFTWETAADSDASGSCGTGVTWKLEGTGCMTISGIGTVSDNSGWAAKKSEITSIIIEKGVTGIGAQAFAGLNNLQNIYSYADKLTVASNAFSGVTATVYYPAESVNTDSSYGGSVKWVSYYQHGEYDFVRWILDSTKCLTFFGYGKVKYLSELDTTRASIKKVVIGDGINQIDTSAFANFSVLETVEIPDSVSSIGNGAFYSCQSLKELTLPKSMTSLSTIADYSGVETINIPASINSISSGMFTNMGSLANINVDSQNTAYCSENGLLYNKDATELICVPANNKATVLRVKSDVTKICGNAAKNNTNIQEVVLPEGLTLIQSSAFEGCTNLAAINVPSTLTEIQSYAFVRTAIKTMTLPKEMTAVPYGLFEDCDKLETVILPESVTMIQGTAFKGCSALTGIRIPEGVTSIEREAFYGCSALRELILPESVTSLGYDVIRNCQSLKSFRIPAGVTTLDKNTFRGVGDSVVLSIDEKNPNYQISDGCLIEKNSKKLMGLFGAVPEKVVIADGIEIIGSEAFYNSSIKEVVIPASVKKIESSAFSNARNLMFVTFLGETAPEIYYNAFNYCKASVYYPSESESWSSVANNNYYGTLAWLDLNSNMLAVGTYNGLKWELDKDGVLTLNYSGYMPYMSPLYVEDGPAVNAPWYRYWEMIRKVVIEEGMKSLTEAVFKNYKNLTEVEFPTSLIRVDTEAFANTGLKAVDLSGTSVSYLCDRCFADTELTSLKLPDTLSRIDGEPFPNMSDWAKGYANKDGLAIVGTTFVKYYGTSDVVVIPEGVTQIAKGCLNTEQGAITATQLINTKVKTVVIPSTVTYIPEFCFFDCIALEKIYIPTSVNGIGVFAIGWYRGDDVSEHLKGLFNQYVAIIGTRGCYAQGYCGARFYYYSDWWENDSIVFKEGSYDPENMGVIITAQPLANTMATVGAAVSFTIETMSEDDTFCWQKSTDGGETWTDSASTGAKTNTLTMTAKESFNGYQFRCIITNSKGQTITSDAFTLTVEKKEFAVTDQTADLTVKSGETAVFNVTANETTGVTYQWQKSTDNGKTWANSGSTGATTNTLTMVTKASYTGMQFRCKLTNSAGKIIYTDAIVLTVEIPFAITTQPASQNVVSGATATFKVAATGDSLKYQWQKSTDGGKTWTNSGSTGATTNTLTMVTKASYTGMQFRCKVTSGDVTLYTTAATLTVKAALAITTQPVAKTVTAGADASFSVKATGDGLTYQWQKTTDGTTWANSSMTGAKTATLTVATKASYNGMQFRCKVTDKNGNSVTTNAVKLTVTAAGPAITTQPAAKTVTAGTNAIFSVKATGDGLTYQWQKTTDGTTWANSSMTGAKTATLTVATKASYNGMQFRCKVTDKNGKSVTTNAVKLTVTSAGPAITTQPASQTVTAGANATFKVAATGTDIKYQWQKSTDGVTWANSSMTGATTATLTVATKASYNGLKFRCKVTSGTTVLYTNAVTLTAKAATAVTTQPVSQTVKAGANATFKVAATGDGLKYQWQKSTDGVTWANSSMTGATTATLTVATKASYNGLKFRCKITDSSNTVTYSNTVTLTVQ